MEIIYLLIPLSIVIVGLIVWFFFWSVRNGQFDDLEGPAHRILFEQERMSPRKKEPDVDPPD